MYLPPVVPADLAGLPFVRMQALESLSAIPKVAGCYWIATDEPVYHVLHGAGRMRPALAGGPMGTTVVYNGVADDLRARARAHLCRPASANKGMSGVSVDVLMTGARVDSHTKVLWCAPPTASAPVATTALSTAPAADREGRGTHVPTLKPTKKLPLVPPLCGGSGPVVFPTSREHALASFSAQERAWAAAQPEDATLYLRNGIDVREEKHASHTWLFVWLQLPDYHALRDAVEAGWRKAHGTPQLCSYSEGR